MSAVFEIRDASMNDEVLGILFYYEREKRFFIELLSDYDEWEAPFLFESFVKRGEYSIDSEWSLKWVRERIVPSDRQNIGMILKNAGLDSYDEYRLLVLSEGRCSQDELYIKRTADEMIPGEIMERQKAKVRDVIPLSGNRILVFFKDNMAGRMDIGLQYGKSSRFINVLSSDELFCSVRVSPGGNGIEWDEDRYIGYDKLRKEVKPSNEEYDDYLRFAGIRLADTSKVCEITGYSRQYISRLVSEGRIQPVYAGEQTRMFLKSDIES